ncbi:sulfotransferase family protein [Myxosarcina sp. GI1(2024)]
MYFKIGKYIRAKSQALSAEETVSLHPAPIFILGHAKSGTTAIATLLAKISRQLVTIDPIYRIDPQNELQRQLLTGKLKLKDVVRAHKFYFSTPINKDPKLTFFYQDLRECFPQAKFIFVIRDPRDNIRSFLNRRNIPGHLKHIPFEKRGFVGQIPPIPGKNYIEQLSNRWNLAADTYLANRSQFTLIRYEDFIADKIAAIAHLAHQMQLKPIEDISQFIDIQYQPSGDRSSSWLEFFGNNFQTIETICGERMNYFDYPLFQPSLI